MRPLKTIVEIILKASFLEQVKLENHGHSQLAQVHLETAR